MSSMARTLECPAWIGRAATAQLEALPEKQWTADGARAHDVLSGDLDEEDVEDSDEVSMAVGICQHKVEMLLVGAGFEDPVVHIEQRIFLRDDRGNAVASGKPDRVYIEGTRFFLPDFKTGRKDAPAPAMNPQLIGYAVLVAQEHGLADGVLAIIPAWRQTPPVAEINAEQIAQWRAAILDAIAESNGPSPRAKAGPHCDYCPARPFCAEAWEIVKQATQLSCDTTMFDSPETVLSYFETAKHAEGTIKSFLEQVKARLNSQPDSIPGLVIGKGAQTKTIPGGCENFDRLTALYSPEVVLAAIKWTPAALAKVISPGKGQKAAQKALEEELASIIEIKPKAGAIERV